MLSNVLSTESTGQTLKKISLLPGYGYALIPRDWIVLNEDEASASKYGYVFEARNHEKYGVPHFVYFSNICYWDVPTRDEICDRMDELIKQHSSTCREAFKHQVEAQFGENGLINVEEWDKSFVPGHFNLPVAGSALPYSDGDFPFDARIKRPDIYTFEEETSIWNKMMSL